MAGRDSCCILQNPGSNQAITYSIVSNPTKGTISQFDQNTGTLVYTPTVNQLGTDTFQYMVTNSGSPNPGLASQPATVTINLAYTPVAPMAGPVTQNVPGGSPTPIQLAGGSNNPGKNQAILYTLLAQPTRGTISQFDAGAGTFVYTPKVNAPGTDTFQYMVTDVGAPNDGLASQAATVTLNLVYTPVAPTAAAVTRTAQGGNSTTIELLGDSRNPGSNQALNYTITTPPTKGTISQFNPSTGTLVYTPTGNPSGTDTFQYTVTTVGTPGSGLTSQPATVTLNLVQDQPPATLTPVTVQGVKWQTIKLSRKKTSRVLEVSFSDAIDQGAAQNVNNYQLVAAGKDKKFGTRDDKPLNLASAVYNSSAHTVRLTPRGKVPKQALQLTIIAAGTLDANQQPIDGNRDGVAGGDFRMTLQG